jgi:hypothetical protein
MKVSPCNACASLELIELSSEVCLHFPGLKGLEKNPIYASPKLTICLKCGFIQSNLSAKELEQVRAESVDEAPA